MFFSVNTHTHAHTRSLTDTTNPSFVARRIPLLDRVNDTSNYNTRTRTHTHATRETQRCAHSFHYLRHFAVALDGLTDDVCPNLKTEIEFNPHTNISLLLNYFLMPQCHTCDNFLFIVILSQFSRSILNWDTITQFRTPHHHHDTLHIHLDVYDHPTKRFVCESLSELFNIKPTLFPKQQTKYLARSRLVCMCVLGSCDSVCARVCVCINAEIVTQFVPYDRVKTLINVRQP